MHVATIMMLAPLYQGKSSRKGNKYVHRHIYEVCQFFAMLVTRSGFEIINVNTCFAFLETN